MAVSDRSFAGRGFALAEVQLIREIVKICAGLSRMELAHTVCELVGWNRPSGALKAREIVSIINKKTGEVKIEIQCKQNILRSFCRIVDSF